MTIKIIDVIDKDDNGPVYKAQNEQGEFFAIKVVPANQLSYVELDILTRLKSPYLIRSFENKFLEFDNLKGYAVQLKEYNLSDIDISKISYHQFKRILISLMYGLECLHKNGFLHLDIRAENILYSYNQQYDINVYMSDFGRAIRCSNAYNGIYTNKLFNSGDNKEELHYNDKDDVYCLGMVFLRLLGSKLDIQNSKDTKEEITEQYIEELIRTYNKNKTSQKEEIFLKEMLVHMLKKDPLERIGSDEFNRLNIYHQADLENFCNLNKPKELVAMCYISPAVRRGIKIIYKYYQEKASEKRLQEYFLTFQNFLELMAKSKTFINDSEMEYLVKSSFDITNNYYHQEQKGDYEIAKRLKGQMGFNFYNYANYLEDLVILNDYMLSNYDNILAYFNALNICEIFRVFRGVYNYKYVNKHNMLLEDFFKMPVPVKREDIKINILDPYDYYNKNEEEERSSGIERYNTVENMFRSEIIDYLRLELYDQYREKGDEILKAIETVDNSNSFQKYLALKEDKKSLSEAFININEHFKYGLITLDSNKEIKTQTGQDDEFVIVLTKNNSSMLHLDRGNKKVVHYYSHKIESIKQLYEKYGYTYSVDYQYGVSNCCKILEACIIFIIYYNHVTNGFDFNTKCLNKNTLYVMVLYLLL